MQICSIFILLALGQGILHGVADFKPTVSFISQNSGNKYTTCKHFPKVKPKHALHFMTHSTLFDKQHSHLTNAIKFEVPHTFLKSSIHMAALYQLHKKHCFKIIVLYWLPVGYLCQRNKLTNTIFSECKQNTVIQEILPTIGTLWQTEIKPMRLQPATAPDDISVQLQSTHEWL